MTLNMEATKAANGGEVPPEVQQLPASRQAAWAQGNLYFQETCDERDRLLVEARQLKTVIAGLKAALEAKDTQAADMESRVNTMTLTRDEAVGRRVEVETLLGVIMALGRAFQIKNAPLVKARSEDDEVPAIGGA